MTIKDSLEQEFEKGRNSKNKKYILKLFVAGISPKSLRAIENLKNLCQEYRINYKLEIIDIYQNPVIAREDQILAAPTLIKELPLPVKKFIGDMSDRTKLIIGLELNYE